MQTAPISLYFGVAKGRRANLETIAQASLEWANLIRDVAAVVAPDLEFEIEFDHAADGSVWLNNFLRAVKEGDRKALASIVIAVLAFFAMGPALHLQSDFGAWLLKQAGHDDAVDLSDESLKKIEASVRKAVDETSLENRRRAIIEAAERDPEITSIGVDFEPRADGPVTRITREQFASYDQAAPSSTPRANQDQEDVAYERNLDVTVLRANLRAGDKRPRWRFRQGDDEWSATIEDEEFIWALNQEKTGLPLAVGQRMRVDVAIDLKMVDGEWEPSNRRIVKVRSPAVRRRQGELGLGS